MRFLRERGRLFILIRARPSPPLRPQDGKEMIRSHFNQCDCRQQRAAFRLRN